MTDICIGIDLGTTNSCVGVWINDQVHIIANDLGHNTTPSIVYYDNNSKIVGNMARFRLNRYPKQTIYGVKRMIGQKFQNSWLEEFNYQVEPDQHNNPVIVLPNGNRLRPEEISAQVLIKMRQIAESYLGHTVVKAVITVPAYFNDGQRNATRSAARIAGLDVVRMINEPTAACLCYGLNQLDQESHVLVYDLGGGTLDVSLLSLNGGLFEVLATSGDCHLGGEDFDLELMNYFIATNGFDLTSSQKNKLKTACEDLKRQLSQSDQAYYLLEEFLQGEDFTLEVSLSQWNQICHKLLDRCLAPVDQVLLDAELHYDEIDQIVLVGGSTRIKSIQDRLSKYFKGKPLNKSVNPDEAVAYGAAIQGAILTKNDTSGKTEGMVLVDVTPLSLGLETTGGMMSVIVSRNSSIPCEYTSYYTTIENNQEEVELKIYQGERQLTSDCRLLGTFQLKGIPQMVRGIPKIKVIFKIDSDGILSVQATEEISGINQQVVVGLDSTRLTESEIERLIKEADLSRTQDEQLRLHLENRCKMLETIEDYFRMIGDVECGDNINSVADLNQELMTIKQTIKSLSNNELNQLVEWQKNLENFIPKINNLYQTDKVKNEITTPLIIDICELNSFLQSL